MRGQSFFLFHTFEVLAWKKQEYVFWVDSEKSLDRNNREVDLV